MGYLGLFAPTADRGHLSQSRRPEQGRSNPEMPAPEKTDGASHMHYLVQFRDIHPGMFAYCRSVLRLSSRARKDGLGLCHLPLCGVCLTPSRREGGCLQQRAGHRAAGHQLFRDDDGLKSVVLHHISFLHTQERARALPSWRI